MAFTKHMVLIALGALALSACSKADSSKQDAPTPKVEASAPAPVAQAKQALMSHSFPVMNAGGYELGSVTINDTPTGVDVVLDITSIPAGAHAIHFHQTGACDGPDFSSSGGHYNPHAADHGHEVASGPHAGDMKNFEAPQSGTVKQTIKNDKVSLSARDNFAPLLDDDGTALIIHAGPDDYVSQPSGAAGARIACAVIAK